MILRNKEDIKEIVNYYIFDYKNDTLWELCDELDNFEEFKSIIKSGEYENVIEQMIADDMINKELLI